MRIPASPAALADLDTFLRLAETADPGGAARLAAHGSVLAVLVCPVRGAGRPTAIGVRALSLAEPLDLDATVDLAQLRSDVRSQVVPPSGGPGSSEAGDGSRAGDRAVTRTGASAGAAAWAGMAPPRGGWRPVDDPADLDPQVVAALTEAAQRLRLLRDAPGPRAAGGAVYGLAGPWTRLSTVHGDVLGRRPPSLLIRQRPRPGPGTP